MLVVLSIAWGVTWPFNRIALDGVPPFSMRVATDAARDAGRIRDRDRATAQPPAAGGRRVAPCRDRRDAEHLGFHHPQRDRPDRHHDRRASSFSATACRSGHAFWRGRSWENGSRGREFSRSSCASPGSRCWSRRSPAPASRPDCCSPLAAGVSWAAGTVYLKWAQIRGRSAGDRRLAACRRLGGRRPRRCRSFEGRAAPVAAAGAHHDGAGLCRGWSGPGLCYFLWFAIVRRLPAGTASLGVLAAPGDRHRGFRDCARRAADAVRLYRLRAHSDGGRLRADRAVHAQARVRSKRTRHDAGRPRLPSSLPALAASACRCASPFWRFRRSFR